MKRLLWLVLIGVVTAVVVAGCSRSHTKTEYIIERENTSTTIESEPVISDPGTGGDRSQISVPNDSPSVEVETTETRRITHRETVP